MNVTENSRYGSLTSETKRLVLGAYGKLPGKVKEEIVNKASENPPEEENEKNLEEIAQELKVICHDNDLPDLSDNTESLLTYTLFSNIAVKFFKDRNF